MDTGEPIKASNRRLTCPNCGSNRYLETVSKEHCASCGLQMDYWGTGGNEVYGRYQARECARQEAADQERLRQEQSSYWDQLEDDHL